MTSLPKAIETFPDLLRETAGLLEQEGHGMLARQVPELEIHQCCGCDDDFCTSFYTAPRPPGSYGPGHRNIVLPATVGVLILDVVDGCIMHMEILDRPRIRPAFDAIRQELQKVTN